MDFKSTQNLNKNQIKNMLVEVLDTFPSVAEIGQIFYHVNEKKLYVKLSTGWQYLAFGTNEAVPSGMIAAYYGVNGVISVAPDGWKFCDGSNGTPDLRDRFIKALPDYTIQARNGLTGSATHTHDLTGHTHTFSFTVGTTNTGTWNDYWYGGEPNPAPDGHTHIGNKIITSSTVVALTSAPASSNPRYCEVCFIMKI